MAKKSYAALLSAMLIAVGACAGAAESSTDSAPPRVELIVDAGAPETTAAAATCPPPLSRCDGACVDVMQTTAHCGSCNLLCAKGRSCSLGECVVGGSESDDAREGAH